LSKVGEITISSWTTSYVHYSTKRFSPI